MSLDASLGRIISAAMELWVRMKAEGTTYSDRLEVMEATVRRVWPFVREWHSFCDECSDTGWLPGQCTPQTPCGRPFRLPKQPDYDKTGQGHCAPNHRYVRPCFCHKGRLLQAAIFDTPAVSAEDYAAAGRTRKMTRLGR